MKIYNMYIDCEKNEYRANVLNRGEQTIKELDPRLDCVRHSPTGFCWGYAGSGPSQLAFAILADATRCDELALKHYREFTSSVVGVKQMTRGWSITDGEVCQWIRERETEALSSSG